LGPDYPFREGKLHKNQFRVELSILISCNLEKQPIPNGRVIKVAFLHRTYILKVSKN